METDYTNLYITHMDVVPPFFKLYGSDMSLLFRVEQIMNGLLEQNLIPVRPSAMQLPSGTICAAITSAGCRRARVLRMDAEANTVIVRFSDYGYEKAVELSDLRVLDTPTVLPPVHPELSEELWLADQLVKATWDRQKISFVHRLLECKVSTAVTVIDGIKLIKIIVRDASGKNEDFGTLLEKYGLTSAAPREYQVQLLKQISMGLPRPFHIPPPNFGTTQLPFNDTLPPINTYPPAKMQSPSPSSTRYVEIPRPEFSPAYVFNDFIQQPSMTSRSRPTAPFPPLTPYQQQLPYAVTPSVTRMALSARPPGLPSPPMSTATIRQFHVNTLPVDSVHDVILCCVINGLSWFAVHLKTEASGRLQELSNELKMYKARPYRGQMLPGSVCLAVLHDNLCRGVVSHMSNENVSVYFVDFGDTSIVEFDAIYEIPPQFLVDPVFAYRFTLANVDRDYFLTTDEARIEFLKYMNKCLRLKVTEPEVPTKQFCELFEYRGKWLNVADLILQSVKVVAPTDYSKIVFVKNSTVSVLVPYAETPMELYVQRVVDIDAAEALSDELTMRCANNELKELLFAEDVVCGMPVCAKYDDDRWYRAQVISDPCTDGFVVIQFVDFGNTNTVLFGELRQLSSEFINKHPKLVTACRLKKDVELTTSLLETFIEIVDGQIFSMKVFDVTDDMLVVDLFDDENRSVSDMLDTAIPVPESTVSPPSHGPNREKARLSNENYSTRKSIEPDRESYPESEVTRRRQPDGLDEGGWKTSHKPLSYNAADDKHNRDNLKEDHRPHHHNGYGSASSRLEYGEVNAEMNREPRWGGGDAQEHNRKLGYGNRDRTHTDDRIPKWGVRDRGYDDDKRPCRGNRDDTEGEDNRKPRWGSRDGPQWGNRGDTQGEDNRKPRRGNRDDNQAEDNRKPRWENKEDHQEDNRKPRWGGDEHDDRCNQNYQNPRWDNRNVGQQDDNRRSRYGNRDTESSNKPRFEHRNEDEDGNRKSNWNHRDGAQDTWKREPTDRQSGWDNKSDSQDTGGSQRFNKNRDDNSFGDRSFRSSNTSSFRSDDNKSSWRERDDIKSSWGESREKKEWRSNDRGRGSGWNESKSQGSWGNNDQNRKRSFAPQLVDGYEQSGTLPELVILPDTQMDVEITWFSNPGLFYASKVDDDEFKTTMEDLQIDYPKRKPADVNSLEVGSYVAAKHTDDVIYRAKVLQKRPEGVMVSYVDYGNTELVGNDRVWCLGEKHCTLPRHAIRCELRATPAGDAWPAADTMAAYFEEDRYTATFVLYDDLHHSWMVNLIGKDGDLVTKLIADGIAAVGVTLESEEPYDIKFLRGQSFSVYVCLAEAASKFFVHLEPQKALEIEKLIEALIEANGLQPLPAELIKDGEYCLAPSDDAWYRALILSIDANEETADISYIDYGDQNTVKFDQIMILPENLCIYNARAIECSIVDADKLQDESDFIENVSEKDLILKVEDVIDNKLISRVFDVNGSQLPYPEPSSVAIPTICSLTVLRRRELVTVSHVTATSIYVQRVSDDKDLSELATNLETRYEGHEQSEYEKREGAYFAVKSVEFSGWYRGKLIKENTVVYYIDYGNEESLSDVESVVPLDTEFHAYPEYCLAVSVLSVTITPDADLTPLLDSLSGVTFVALLEHLGDGWWASLRTEDDVAFGEYVKTAGVGTVANLPTTIPVLDEWQLGDTLVTRVSHTPSPSVVHVQRSEDRLALETLQAEIKSAMTRILPLVGHPKDDFLYAALKDGSWYRVAVTSDITTAVDYGFPLDEPRLHKLPTDLAKNAPYCVMCETNIEPPDAEWSDAAKTRFNDLIYKDEAISVRYDAILNNVRIVDLLEDGISVLESLVEEGLARWRRYPVIVSHANSLADFYVQYMNDIGLDTITEALTEAAQWDDAHPEVGDLIAAKFEDGEWYRAVVTEKKDSETSVRFVDFGNVSSCEEFKTLPPSISEQNPFCVQCTLHPLPENADTLNNKFVKFIEAENTFHISFLQRGTPSLCQLYYKNEPIVDVLAKPDEIKETCTDEAEKIEYGTICYINSPCSFYVHTGDDVFSLQDALSELEGAEVGTVKVGDLVAAKFPEDDAWYRACVREITEDGAINVFFIDYGNKSMVTEWRQLPEALREQKPLALHCAFRLPTSLAEWPRDACTRFSELSNEATFVLRRLEETDDVTYVELLDNGASVAEELVTLCHADMVTADEAVSNLKEALVSEVLNTGELWLQYENHELDEMTAEMESAGSFDEISQPELGDLVAAVYSEDELWYRAKIIDKSDSDYGVLFVDYGNKSRSSTVRALPADLASLPPLAHLCRLPVEGTITDSAMQKLREFTVIHKFVVRIIEEGEIPTVSLSYDGDKDLVLEIMKMDGSMPSTETPNEEDDMEVSVDSMTFVSSLDKSGLTEYVYEERKFDNRFIRVRIPYAVSQSKFYVQTDFDDLAKVKELMRDADLFDNCTKTDERMVAAKNGGQWHRARILLQSGCTYRVQCYDTGFKFFTTDIRMVPSELSDILPIAVKCSLMLPKNIRHWVSDATEKFLSIVNEPNAEFTCKIVEDEVLESSKLVILKQDGKDVVDTLFRKTITISYCESINSFWGQSDIEAVEHMTEELYALEIIPLMMTDVELFAQPVLVWDTNDVRHRAMVRTVQGEDLHVQLIDIGSRMTVNVCGHLPDTISSLPPLAETYALWLPPWLRQNTSLNITFVTNIGTGTSVYEVHIVGERGDTKLVEMYMEGVNVLSVLTDASDCGQFNVPGSHNISDDQDIADEPNADDSSKQADLPGPSLEHENVTRISKDPPAWSTLTLQLSNIYSEKNLSDKFDEGANSVDVILTHVNNPSSFYVCAVDDVARVKLIDSTLQEVVPQVLEKMTLGSLVSATCYDFICRARIVDVQEGVTPIVQCIDHGNVLQPHSIFALPVELAAIPPLALHCSLKYPLNYERLSWPQRVTDEFVKKALVNKPTFKMHLIAKGAVTVVELTNESINIAECLLTLLEQKHDSDDERGDDNYMALFYDDNEILASSNEEEGMQNDENDLDSLVPDEIVSSVLNVSDVDHFEDCVENVSCTVAVLNDMNETNQQSQNQQDDAVLMEELNADSDEYCVVETKNLKSDTEYQMRHECDAHIDKNHDAKLLKNQDEIFQCNEYDNRSEEKLSDYVEEFVKAVADEEEKNNSVDKLNTKNSDPEVDKCFADDSGKLLLDGECSDISSIKCSETVDELAENIKISEILEASFDEILDMFETEEILDTTFESCCSKDSSSNDNFKDAVSLEMKSSEINLEISDRIVNLQKEEIAKEAHNSPNSDFIVDETNDEDSTNQVFYESADLNVANIESVGLKLNEINLETESNDGHVDLLKEEIADEAHNHPHSELKVDLIKNKGNMNQEKIELKFKSVESEKYDFLDVDSNEKPQRETNDVADTKLDFISEYTNKSDQKVGIKLIENNDMAVDLISDNINLKRDNLKSEISVVPKSESHLAATEKEFASAEISDFTDSNIEVDLAVTSIRTSEESQTSEKNEIDVISGDLISDKSDLKPEELESKNSEGPKLDSHPAVTEKVSTSTETSEQNTVSKQTLDSRGSVDDEPLIDTPDGGNIMPQKTEIGDNTTHIKCSETEEPPKQN